MEDLDMAIQTERLNSLAVSNLSGPGYQIGNVLYPLYNVLAIKTQNLSGLLKIVTKSGENVWFLVRWIQL